MYRSTQKRKSLLAGLFLASALAASPVMAQDQAVAEPQASLSAQASTEVDQDTVQVTLAAELSGADQAEVSQALNTRLDSVMKQAKGHEGIEVSSGSYRIWPTSNRDGKVSEWRGHAAILLRGHDFDAVSRLAAQLADRMPIDGMAFSVSDQRRAAAEQELLSQAVEAFKTRAQALTQALGFAAYQFRSVDLGGSGVTPIAPMPRMMSAMAADKAAAPIEGGRETITVSVQGTIALQPK